MFLGVEVDAFVPLDYRGGLSAGSLALTETATAVSLFVCLVFFGCLTSQCVYLKDGFAQTILHAATLR